jgi:DNA-directed RNA polymerase specialized sigma24 family protein
MIPDEKPSELSDEDHEDREGDHGPWTGGSLPLYPIAHDETFSKFYKETFEKEARRVQGKYPGAAPDIRTAGGIVADAFEALYEKKETIEKNPVWALRDEIKNLVRKEDRRRTVSLNSPGFPGDSIPADSEARSVASDLGERELHTLFSHDAVECLNRAERLLYDLKANGLTLEEIARRSGISFNRVKKDWHDVYIKLCDIMGRLASRLGDEKREPIRTPIAAFKAIDDLPVLLRKVVALFHVENVPAAQIALRIQLASADEVTMHLGRAYEILENLYGQKMPEALVAALTHVHGNTGKRRGEGR